MMKFDPEVVQMCSKLSGLAASYSTKEKFDSMLHFLSKRFDISFLFPKKVVDFKSDTEQHLQFLQCF